MIALGWANIGAAVAPDAALASIASAIILVMGGQGEAGVDTAIAVAIPLAVGRTVPYDGSTYPFRSMCPQDGRSGSQRKLWRRRSMAYHRDLHAGTAYRDPGSGTACDPTSTVQGFLESMPAWLTDGMSIGGGMVVAVGYAMVINMMATREVWPFFAIDSAWQRSQT